MRNECRYALRTASINCTVNAVLAILKITMGMSTRSKALISDGVHSVTDMIATVVVMIGIALSGRRPDNKHPYGCERLECVAAVLVSVIIGITGVGIMSSGIAAIRLRSEAVPMIGATALWTAIVSIAVKEAMYRYSAYCARRFGSSALEADAWHQRTDALSSVGSLIGMIGVRWGWGLLDPLASMAIGALIIKSAVDIFTDAMRKMTDRACDEELEAAIHRLVTECEGVVAVEDLKTRLFADRVYAELTVIVDNALSCKEAYDIAQTIRNHVTENRHQIKACSVHIHPR